MAELLSYLKAVQGRHVTVNDILDHFKSERITIGTATIYRHLERMVEEGVAAKYIVDGKAGACFEYIGERDDLIRPTCYHCKCKECGKLIHLHCDEVANLGQHMLAHHNFEMDPLRTVFYGICGECRAAHR